MYIAIDFDGTVVEHMYPEVGKDVPGAVEVLKGLSNNGHMLILFTMRDKQHLKEAVNWFKERDIPLYGIQENPSQKKWTGSPKAYANIYIDDAALGCPITHSTETDRPCVDWKIVRTFLSMRGIL